MQNRPDIDGLRAVAVLLVVAYHSFPNALKGGFVGVDVFFVISGFLITRILLNEMVDGTFALTQFYARRIRRLFPALAVVLATTTAAGWVVLYATEYRDLGTHVAAGAAFVSNFAHWYESGYFDDSASAKPLLHLWSLGIEEQFYIVWPLALYAAWRRHMAIALLTLVLMTWSFATNIFHVHSDPVLAFYSPQTRAWEILAGAAIACTAHKRFRNPQDRSWITSIARSRMAHSGLGRLMRELASITGLASIVAIAYLATDQTPYPGFLAIVPVAGAVLLITVGSDTWVNRSVLGNRLLVRIGLISYPLYLWHWPLLSFATILEGSTPGRLTRATLVLISFALAWLTWRYIEAPIRRAKPRTATMVSLGGTMLAIAIAGLVIAGTDGLPGRSAAEPETPFDGDVGQHPHYQHLRANFPVCTPASIADQAPTWRGHVRCLQSRQGEPVDLAIIGDSHAEDLFPGLAEHMPDRNIAVYVKNANPYIDEPSFKDIFHHVATSPTIVQVVISAHWIGRFRQVPDGSTLQAELTKTVLALSNAGKRVYITDDWPSFPFEPTRCQAARRPGLETRCTIPLQQPLVGHSDLFKRIQREIPGTTFLETYRFFCGPQVCSMTNGSTLLFRDKSHLNILGSGYLARQILAAYPGIKTQQQPRAARQ